MGRGWRERECKEGDEGREKLGEGKKLPDGKSECMWRIGTTVRNRMIRGGRKKEGENKV